MAKFNRNLQVPVKSPVRSTGMSGRTHEGAPAYERDAESELFLLAIALMGADKAFYESADSRLARLAGLSASVAISNPSWLPGFMPLLRNVIGMRTASVIIAAEAAHAMAEAKQPGARQLVSAALQRADEPAEFLAYWFSHWGRKLPIAVKRGLADAVFRLYTERAYLTPGYDSREASLRMADVIEIVQPRYNRKAYGTWRDYLYRFIIEERHGRGTEIPASLATLRANQALMAAAAEDPRALLDPQALNAAGVKWQNAKSLAGRRVPAKEMWEALIPSMFPLALLRNLRNFDQAGVSDAVAEFVATRLSNPTPVREARLLPFQFLAAHRAVSSFRWAHALERGMGHSLSNVPSLRGRTLVLVDRSPSMWMQKLSDKSDMLWADAAAVFGAALALRAENADLAEFWAHSRAVPFRKDEPVLRLVEKFSYQPEPGGTDIPMAVRQHLKPHHNRVVIITDEQTRAGYLPSNVGGRMYGYGNPAGMPETLIDDLVPKSTPLYMWNFGGYKEGAAPSGTTNRHTLGGLSDHAFSIIPLLEARRDASWENLFALGRKQPEQAEEARD